MTISSILNKVLRPKVFLPFLLGMNLLVHYPFMDMPPVSVHTWRQCNSLAVARNFHEEDMNIFKPRIDRRGAGDGVTGMQFPSYEWIVAIGYKAFGEQHWVARTISLLITSLGILAFFGVCQLLFKDPRVALLGAWAYTWSPELYYHGINALPDILALAAGVGAFYFYLKWRKDLNTWNFSFSLFLITLAGLTKAQYLLIGAPIAAMTIMDHVRKEKPIKAIVPLAVYGAVALGITIGWYSYARELIATSGLNDFAIHAGQSFPNSIGKALSILWNNLVIDLPETLLGYSSFVLMLVGLVFLARERSSSKWKAPMVFWGIMLLVYYVFEIGQLEFHLYYLLPFLPFLALIAALGARRILAGRYAWLLLILVIAAPLQTTLKIIPARWTNEKTYPRAEFKDDHMLTELQNAVPNDAYTIVGNDDSGCIYFYYLHKRGSGFNSREELFEEQEGRSRIERWTDEGAEYLYSDDRTIIEDERMEPFIQEVLTEVGSFTVISLKQKDR